MISVIQRFLLFSIIFFSISQFGKHFWPYFAYVSGIRVDYLSPTIYFTDILIVFLVFVSLPRASTYLFKQRNRIPFVLLTLIFILCTSISVAKYSLPALYGAVKALEMVYVGYMVSRHISEKDSSLLAFLLSGAIVIEGILVVMQITAQSSIGGLWYYLGERTFSVTSVGISTVPFFGRDILRAYGSFPHPNVLSFFMLIGSVVTLHMFPRVLDMRWKIWYGATFGVSLVSLFSTFSRVSILLFLCIIAYLFITRSISRLITGALLVVGFAFMGVFIQRFGFSSLFSEDLMLRLDLAQIALEVISQHAVFGVGINNYLYYQIDYQQTLTPVLLQPPHNIYLLILLQTGVIGIAGAVYVLWKTLERAKRSLVTAGTSSQGIASILFLCILTIGMGDHYFLTLQQGMILAAFVIGMVWIPRDDD